MANIEVHHPETVMYLEAFETIPSVVKHLENVRSQENKPIVLEYTFTGESSSSYVNLDDRFLKMINGGRWGAYLSLRNMDLQPTANHIMLTEGHPQQLTTMQKVKLRRIDKLLKPR